MIFPPVTSGGSGNTAIVIPPHDCDEGDEFDEFDDDGDEFDDEEEEY